MNQDTLFIYRAPNSQVANDRWLVMEDSIASEPSVESIRFFNQSSKTILRYRERNTSNELPLWMHLSFLFWVIIIIATKQSYAVRLRLILGSVYNRQQVKLLQREGSLLTQAYPVLLLFLNVFSLSVFIYRILFEVSPHHILFTHVQGFLILFAGIALLMFLKFFFIAFIGHLFENKEESNLYLLEHLIFYITQAFFLFPLAVIFVYSNQEIFLYLAMFVVIVLWAYRLIRAIGLGIVLTNFSRFYIFLYLCSFEILPILVLFKFGIQMAG